MATFYEDWSSAYSDPAANTAPSGGTNTWVLQWAPGGAWDFSFVTDGGAIGGKYLRFSSNAAASAASLLVPSAVGTSGSLGNDVETDVLVKFRGGALGEVLAFQPVILRAAATAGNHYALIDLSGYGSGGPLYNLSYCAASSTTDEVIDATQMTGLASKWMWARVNVSKPASTTIWKYKLWFDDDGQPGGAYEAGLSWVTTGDNPNHSTAVSGYVGFGAYSKDNSPYDVQYFAVGTAGDTAPSPGGSSHASVMGGPFGRLLRGKF